MSDSFNLKKDASLADRDIMFGESVALCELLLEKGYTSEENALHIKREDFEKRKVDYKLCGAMRADASEFMFWVEVIKSGLH